MEAYPVFLVQLLSLNGMRHIHLLLVTIDYYVNITEFISSTVDGHLGHFLGLAIWNSASVNDLVIQFHFSIGCFSNTGISGI